MHSMKLATLRRKQKRNNRKTIGNRTTLSFGRLVLAGAVAQEVRD